MLARAGAKVLAVDRDLTLADRTVEVTAAEGGNAVAASYDVTSSAKCAAMVKEAVSRWVSFGSRGNRACPGLSRSHLQPYRFAEPRTDAADIMSTIELVDPELRDALALAAREPLTADSLMRRRANLLKVIGAVPQTGSA